MSPAGGAGWRGRRGILARIVAALCGVLLLVLAATVWWPGAGFAHWVSTRTVVAQAISFPRPMGVGLLLVGLGVVMLGAWLLRRGHRLGAWWGSAALPAMVAAAGLLAFPAGLPPTNSGGSAPAGAAGSPAGAAGGPAGTASGGPELSVVTFNSLNALTGDDLAHLESELTPDVVVLPETSHERATRAVEQAGWPGRVVTSDTHGRWAPDDTGIEATSVLLRETVPAYTREPVTPSMQGSLRLAPTDPRYPLLLAVHPAAPVPGWMEEWRRDAEGLLTEAEEAAAQQDVLLVGDLNATSRHGRLANPDGLVDSARLCGTPQGTWPAGWPAWARSAIDHVVVSQGTGVRDCRVLQVGTSDHLAYATTVALPG